MTKLQINCCICMRQAEKLTSLIIINNADVVTNTVRYIDMLNYCVPTKEIWKECYQICDTCINHLNVTYNFIRLCAESEFFRKHNLNDEHICSEKNNFKTIRYNCDDCGKSFKEKKYLTQHMTKLHIKKKESQKNSIKYEKKENEEHTSDESTSAVVNEEDLNLPTNRESPIKNEERENKTIILQGCTSADATENQPSCIKLEEVSENVAQETIEQKIELKDEHHSEEGEDYHYASDSETEINEKPKQKTKSKYKNRKAPLKCDFCIEFFPKRQDWLLHIRAEHKFEKPFSCDECSAKYKNSYSLLIHKRKHTNEKPYICATCGKSFVASADLNHHSKTHNLNRAYSCPLCDRRFKTHSNLRTHRLQMHLDPAEWKFHCNLCNKKFPIRSNLVKHLKRHAGIKEFNCQICEKKFVNKAELKLHFNTHTNQRHYKCQLCIKEYKNREGLRRHMKVVHDLGNWKPPKKDNIHPCSMCTKVFPFRNKLQRHMFIHTGEKLYKCDYCDKGFMDNYRREEHYKKCHVF